MSGTEPWRVDEEADELTVPDVRVVIEAKEVTRGGCS